MKLGKKMDLDAIIQSIEDAPIEKKSEAIVKAIQAGLDFERQNIIAEYENMFAQVESNKDLSQKFGLRNLNQEEKDFYQKVTEGMYSGNDHENVIPQTTLNYIFEDLKTSRPLFNHIDWAPAGLKKWILGEVTGEATWGKLDSKIKDEIKATLTDISLDTFKLSAFAFVPQGIIDLGFEWVDKYVREALIEANAAGLEKSFVVGDGSEGPIGMNKKLKGAVDGVHSDRTPIKIEDFTPKSFGEILAQLTNDGKRVVSKVLLIVNPKDDFTLVRPASSFLTSAGEYRTVFPVNTEVVQVVGVPEGKAILYIPKTYQAGVNKMGIYTSDEFKFLDHARTYKVVTYGNGRLKRENMAAYLDISDLKPLSFNVKTPEGETVEGA